VGLAICSALQVFAQQKETIDPKVEQQIRMLAWKYDTSINKQGTAWNSIGGVNH
jgi:hypothetical protein